MKQLAKSNVLRIAPGESSVNCCSAATRGIPHAAHLRRILCPWSRRTLRRTDSSKRTAVVLQSTGTSEDLPSLEEEHNSVVIGAPGTLFRRTLTTPMHKENPRVSPKTGPDHPWTLF